MKYNKKTKCYFLTGTGRCGTMLFSKLFSLSNYSICEHEKIFRHISMLHYFQNNDFSYYENDIQQHLIPIVESNNKKNINYGISSGHMYFSIPYLNKIYGDAARYILLLRKPEEFARSALARGYFDVSHIHRCIQIEPISNNTIFDEWSIMSPLEKCLWYWDMVNGFVLNSFSKLNPNIYRIVKIEDLDLNMAIELNDFLGLNDIDDSNIERLLSQKVNASPGEKNSGSVNPYSLPKTLGSLSEWNDTQKDQLNKFAGNLRVQLYGKILK